MRVGDLTPVPKYNLYQIRVYANSKRSRYYTFCTPECRKAIDNYLDYRRSSGEHITPNSPLIRKEFDKRDIFKSANDVKPVSRSSIKQIMRDILYMSGLRTPIVIPEGKLNYRRSIAMNHSFRKFFDTTCTHAGMNPIYIEWCMGHSLKGVKDSYFLPQPDSNGVYIDLLEGHDKSLGYIDAIPYLTIDNSQCLERENEMSEYEYLKEQIEETKREQAKFTSNYMAFLKGKLGIPKEVNEINLTFDPNEHDLDRVRILIG